MEKGLTEQVKVMVETEMAKGKEAAINRQCPQQPA